MFSGEELNSCYTKLTSPHVCLHFHFPHTEKAPPRVAADANAQMRENFLSQNRFSTGIPCLALQLPLSLHLITQIDTFTPLMSLLSTEITFSLPAEDFPFSQFFPPQMRAKIFTSAQDETPTRNQNIKLRPMLHVGEKHSA